MLGFQFPVFFFFFLFFYFSFRLMANRAICLEELPAHLLLEILNSGRLQAADLARIEASCRTFRGCQGLIFPSKFASLVEFSAFQLCRSHPMFQALPLTSRSEIFDRCGGKWKLVLRFLQSVEQAFGAVETPTGNVLLLLLCSNCMHILHHTLLTIVYERIPCLLVHFCD